MQVISIVMSKEVLESIITSTLFLYLLFLPFFSFIFVFLSQSIFSKTAQYVASRYATSKLQLRYYYHKFFNVFATGVCVAAVFSSLVCGFLLLCAVLLHNPVYIISIPLNPNSSWIFWDFFFQDLNFQIDSLSSVMLIVITLISLVVHLYSYEYIGFDPFYVRFMSFLNLFTFFMMLLVLSGNILQMFVGWEGVGLSSYLLINFWFGRLEANKSALKAIAMNRFGDTALLVAIVVFIFCFGTPSFSVAFTIIDNFGGADASLFVSAFGRDFNVLGILAWLILMAAIAKSAQLGLHTWLPDAMEGPTPVSALLHAATMVTAGVYSVVRFSFIFEYVPSARAFCIIVGSLTALFGSLVALTQFDIKRVVAFSTTSQLGYMFVACGLSGYHIAMYHLVTHAFFKAFLFLLAGVIIHNLNNEQDFRRMGRLACFAPVTYVFMFVGFLSLSGMPFLSGFYSKDAIIELAFAGSTSVSTYAFLSCSVAAFFTACYSVRVLYLTFFSNLRISAIFKGSFSRVKKLYIRTQSIHDASNYFIVVLAPLFVGSIFAGFFVGPYFIVPGSVFWGSSLFISITSSSAIYFEFFVPGVIKALPILLSFLGYFTVYFIYSRFYGALNAAILNSPLLMSLYGFIGRKWLFDSVYNKFVSLGILKLSRVLYVHLDKGYFEFFGAYGVSRLLYFFSRLLDIFFNEFWAAMIFGFFGTFLIFGFSFVVF